MAPSGFTFISANTTAYNPTCEFEGNDIGGIGAVVAYGSIAFISTIFTIAAISHYSWDEESEPNEKDQEGFRHEILEFSTGFWDTVVWFTIAAGIAGAISLWSKKPESIYEIILTVIVTSLVVHATGALAILYIKPDIRKEDNHKFRVGSQLFAFSASIVNLGTGLYIFFTWDKYIQGYEENQLKDGDCYNPEDDWPKKYLMWVLIETTIILLLAITYCICYVLSRLAERAWFDTKGMFLKILGVLFILSMWFDFTMVMVTRRASTDTFVAGTYQDMSLSYGQLTAGGLAFQSIVFSTCVLFGHFRRTCSCF